MYRRVIIALDVDSLHEAERFIFPEAYVYKVGWRLFSKEGFKALTFLEGKGKRAFLDLKLGDIPSTVTSALREIFKYNPYMTTIHAISGRETFKRAKELRNEMEKDTIILGVTLLTSLSQEDVQAMGMTSVEEGVKTLAKLVEEGGGDGVVCSAAELPLLQGFKLLKVVPGIRLAEERGDQKRVATPYEAFQSGADFIVVGREILHAPDPRRRFVEILMDAGFLDLAQ